MTRAQSKHYRPLLPRALTGFVRHQLDQLVPLDLSNLRRLEVTGVHVRQPESSCGTQQMQLSWPSVREVRLTSTVLQGVDLRAFANLRVLHVKRDRWDTALETPLRALATQMEELALHVLGVPIDRLFSTRWPALRVLDVRHGLLMDEDLQLLQLHAPALRRLAVNALDLEQDHRRRQCGWDLEICNIAADELCKLPAPARLCAPFGEALAVTCQRLAAGTEEVDGVLARLRIAPAQTVRLELPSRTAELPAWTAALLLRAKPSRVHVRGGRVTAAALGLLGQAATCREVVFQGCGFEEGAWAAMVPSLPSVQVLQFNAPDATWQIEWAQIVQLCERAGQHPLCVKLGFGVRTRCPQWIIDADTVSRGKVTLVFMDTA